MRCMVVDSLSGSEKIEEQVYWYKANIHNAFRICYEEFWANNDFYLRERMKLPELLSSPQAEEDDYYKYVGSKNKIIFNLNMQEDQDSQAGQDAEYAENPPSYSASVHAARRY